MLTSPPTAKSDSSSEPADFETNLLLSFQLSLYARDYREGREEMARNTAALISN